MNASSIKGKKKRKTDVRPGLEKLAPCLSSLKKWFQKSNLPLTEQQYKQLWLYHKLLRKKNAEYDLTRLYQFDNMVQKHYIDCILVAKLLKGHLPSPILDIGTGAGFPAIPLKIVCPNTEFILSEGRHKRVQFLHEVIEALGLKKIEIYERKIYDSYSRPVKGVITRAVESIPLTLGRVKRSVVPDGKVIFMKGPHCDEEIQEALTAFSNDYNLDQNIAYTIPHSPYHRRLVIFNRRENTMKGSTIQAWTKEEENIFPFCTRGDLHREMETMGTIHEIESSANKIFKYFKALLTPKGIKKYGFALVFGQKIICEVMRDFPKLCHGLILSPKKGGISGGPFEELSKGFFGESLMLYRLNRTLYNELDIFGTGADILFVKIPSIQQWKCEETKPGCTLMVPFQDPENVGAVIRTAVSFGVKEIVLLQEAANPYHPKSLRSAGSTIFRISFQKGPSIQDIYSLFGEMEQEERPLLTLSMKGEDIRHFQFPAQFILLPGVEGPGLPPDLPSHSLTISMEPGVESLNAATAVAIALYEWRR